jgi:hypothetical protein
LFFWALHIRDDTNFFFSLFFILDAISSLIIGS